MNRTSYIVVNVLTTLRIIGIPFIFLIDNEIARVLFADFLFITDFLDGFLARKLNVSSKLGAILDLIADKMLVLYILLVFTIKGDVWLILFILIAAREIYSMVLRYTTFKKSNKLINASMVGKTKTAFQFITLNFFLLNIWGGNLLLIVVVCLSYYSFLGYFKKSKE